MLTALVVLVKIGYCSVAAPALILSCVNGAGSSWFLIRLLRLGADRR
ncbi:MAG: hypothetical protein ACK5CA_05780 [Cyanobacteriota bacterium]